MGRKRAHDPEQLDLFESRIADIEGYADRFAAALERAGARAKHEEDIRVAVERELGSLSEKLGVTREGEHEYTLLKGHVDSVYGSVFIEYKNPSDSSSRLGPKLSSPGTRKVVEQITNRFRDVTKVTRGGGTAVLGVACDGKYFVFCRFIDGQVTCEEPVEVSRWSARRFVWAVFNLGTRGYALTPGGLARDFGSESVLGRNGVRAFATACNSALSGPRVSTFFRQWRILFGEVCGYDVQSPGRKMQELAKYYQESTNQPAQLLFALHTYYALFMKLLAAHVASFFQRIGSSPLEAIAKSRSSSAIVRQLRELEEGGIFRHLGVTNFLEGDLFAWYLSAWSEGVEDTIRTMATRLLDYNPGSLRDNPTLARDLLKKLYHELFPRQVRHDLGEYYTPDWLAELTLDRVGYDGNPKTRLLDPACGSGTFLVLALNRVRSWLERNFERAPARERVAELASKNVIGFDLNPLAVLAARTNYLIQFYDLFDYRGALEIPVYLCDSVLTPSEFGYSAQKELTEKAIQVPTSAKLFSVPREIALDRETLGNYCNILAEYGREDSGFSADDFVVRCRDEGLPVSESVEYQHRQLFEDIRRLDHDERNGVWARFIKNAFAPVFLRGEPVDLIVGNPPWVNWESLPGLMDAEGELNYRQRIADVFQRYKLFTLSGAAGRLGGGKKDLSMVFVYACVDHYLKMRGKLGFVITQTVFKTKGAGDGFRQLAYHEENQEPVSLVVERVDDLSAFQPFEGATNRTAVFTCRKARQKTRFPVAYTVWKKARKGHITSEWPLSVVQEFTERQQLGGEPIDVSEPTSPWLTAPRSTLSSLHNTVGQSDYRGYEGVNTGGLNGCYWIRVLQEVPGGLLIENLFDVGKIKVRQVRKTIEPDLVYPLIRGRDVSRWRVKPSARIVLTQDPETRRGLPEDWMKRKYPETYAYLKEFQDKLLKRASSSVRKLMETGPFYSMFAVGPYTMSQWKVAWPEVGNEVEAAVVGPEDSPDPTKPALPDHTVVFVPCETSSEAHYLAAVLNSSPTRLLVRSYIALHPSPHVLEFIRIPRFDPASENHPALAALSEQAHRAVVRGVRTDITDAESSIDRVVAKLWGISQKGLAGIRDAIGVTETHPLLEKAADD